MAKRSSSPTKAETSSLEDEQRTNTNDVNSTSALSLRCGSSSTAQTRATKKEWAWTDETFRTKHSCSYRALACRDRACHHALRRNWTRGALHEPWRYYGLRLRRP